MNTIMRALVIAWGVLRALPASVYITFGILSTAFIGLAGPAWESLATSLSMFLTVYGGWRGFRRYWVLHSWTRWEP